MSKDLRLKIGYNSEESITGSGRSQPGVEIFSDFFLLSALLVGSALDMLVLNDHTTPSATWNVIKIEP